MEFDVKYFAKLARIRLGKDEEKRFKEDIGEILQYVRQLEEVDTDNTPPMSGGTNLKNVFRDDGEPKPDADRVTRGLPRKEGGYTIVPRVLDK